MYKGRNAKMLSVGVKNIFYVLDVLTQIYFRLIRNLCTFAIKMAKVLRLGIKNKVLDFSYFCSVNWFLYYEMDIIDRTYITKITDQMSNLIKMEYIL